MMRNIVKITVLCLIYICPVQAVYNYMFQITNKTDNLIVVWPLPISIKPSLMTLTYPNSTAQLGYNDFIQEIAIFKDNDFPLESTAALKNYVANLPPSDGVIYNVLPSDLISSPYYNPIHFNIEIKNNKMIVTPTTQLASEKYKDILKPEYQ